MCAPDPRGAATAAAAPATVPTPPSRSSSPPTFSPSPCKFLWADCAEGVDEEVSVVLVAQPNAARSTASESDGGGLPLGALARAAPPPPGVAPPCFQPRFRRALQLDPTAHGEKPPPPPAGLSPGRWPRSLSSRIGAVGGSLVAPAGMNSTPRHRGWRQQAPVSGDDDGPEGPWQLVQHRRSRQAAAPTAPSSRSSRLHPRRRPRIPLRLRGLCLKCLKRGHFIAECRDPICCRCCNRSGHLERECPEARSAPLLHPHRRATSTSPLRSFRDVLMAPAELAGGLELDVCCSEAKEVELACRRGYKEGVDSALSEENVRDGRMPLLLQGEDGDRETREQEVSGKISATARRGITSWAEVLSDVVLPICGASSPAPSPSLCGDEAVHVDEAVRLLPEMKLNGGPEPCHEITSPCPSQAGSFELDGIDATPSHVGLRQSLSFGVAPTQLFAEDAVAVELTIVNEDSEPSRDAGVQELVSSAPTFIESITARITAPLLSAAPPTPATSIRRRPRNPAPMPTRQASDRRAVTSMAGLSTVERARRVLYKKWGLPPEDEAKGDATEEVRQQRFMDRFKDPKTALETEAVRALFSRVGSSRSVISKTAGRRATSTTAARAARAAEDLELEPELEPPVEAHSRE